MNRYKCATVIILSVLCMLFSGCGPNKISSEISAAEESTEEDRKESVRVANEFECVYVQTLAGVNKFAIYHHVPTGQMYICYVTYSMVPMGMTYDEYIEASSAFHKENDEVFTGSGYKENKSEE